MAPNTWRERGSSSHRRVCHSAPSPIAIDGTLSITVLDQTMTAGWRTSRELAQPASGDNQRLNHSVR